MANIIIERTVPLDQLVQVEPLKHNLYQSEDDSHQFVIHAIRGGETVALSGTASGKFIRADGVTEPLTGTVTDGVLYVTLTANCYYVPGVFALALYVTANGVTSCVYAAAGNVARTDTGVTGSGETLIHDITALIAAIEQATDELPPIASQMIAAIAPTFSSSTSYSAGTYVWQSGVLYKFTQDHAAGSWTGTDAAAAVLSAEIAGEKNAVGHYADGVEQGTGIRALLFYAGKYSTPAAGETANIDAPVTDATMLCTKSAVLPGQRVRYKVGESSTSYRGWAFYDSEFSVLSRKSSNTAEEGTLVAPDTAAWVVFNMYVSSSAGCYAYIGDNIPNTIEGYKESITNGFNAATGITVYPFRGGGYYQTSDNVNANGTWAENKGYCGVKITCGAGVSFRIHAAGAAGNTRAYAFYNANNELISRPTAGVYDKTITTPENTAYVVINNRLAGLPNGYYVYGGTSVVDRLSGKQDTLTFDTTPTANSTNPVTSGGVYDVIGSPYVYASLLDGVNFTSGHYWNSTAGIGGTATDGTASGYYKLDAIPVSEGDVIHIKMFSFTSSSNYCIVVADSSYKILARIAGTRGSTYDFGDITMPETAAYLLLTTQGSLKIVEVVCEKRVSKNLNGRFADYGYQGCKMSLLGDSISSINGYSTGGHNYYPNAGSDVNYVEQMWWKQVCNALGMTPLVIGGWSGSTVTSGIRTATSSNSYTPASDPSRCEALDDGTNNPDVILIAMGGNDYSYMSSAEQFGTWDGTTALGSESDLSDYDTTTFRTAYATMLARIQHKYPNAFIVCVTPWFIVRYDTDNGANYLNAIGKSIDDYANAVRDICGIMHVACIDGTNIGFNRYNYYPTYAADSATKPTHLTVAGQKHAAKAFVAQLKALRPLGK